MTTLFMSKPTSLPDPFGPNPYSDDDAGKHSSNLFNPRPHSHTQTQTHPSYTQDVRSGSGDARVMPADMPGGFHANQYPTPPFSPPGSMQKDETIRASQSQGQGLVAGDQTLSSSGGGAYSSAAIGSQGVPPVGTYDGDADARSTKRDTITPANSRVYSSPLSPPSDDQGYAGSFAPLPQQQQSFTAPIPSFSTFHPGSHAPPTTAPINTASGRPSSSNRSSQPPGAPPQLIQHYPSPAAASPAATRKRATYNPSTQTTQTSPSPPRQGAEFALHPSIAAYQVAHPKRQLIQFGPYILLQTLGEGEFGKVKLGVHQEWGEEVAVKLIRRGSIENQAVRMSKVEREIEVLKNVKHPNIVRLFDVIETEKYIGIILDFANGGELFDHILAHRYLKEKDAAKLFAQLISGVHYLHSKKIIHRDLKLENLLLDKHRNVIITDFGFANRFEHKVDDLMATSCGSPCYAAPELVISEGLYVGSAVDVWSCGVILYAMLSGYLPFDDDPANPDGDNINLLYRYIVNTPLTYPEYLSHEARDLLAMMLMPDPLQRCDLSAVMSHPWLAAYAPLFARTVPELEAHAQEQQQHKRLASRREMQARLRMQEQARMNQLARHAKMAEANAAGLPAPRAGGVVMQQRHQSAMPTLSTVPHNLSSLAHSVKPQEFQRPTSLLATEMHHAQSESDNTDSRPDQVEPGAIAIGDAEMPLAEESHEYTTTTVAPLEPPKVILPSASFARPAPAEHAQLATPPREKRPASQNKNRHTIQVEYDGEATYEKMVASQEARRAESVAERSALREQLLALNQPMQVDPVLPPSREGGSAQPMPPGASEMEIDPPDAPQTPTKVSRAAREEETPKASRQPVSNAPETPTGLGILGTPVEQTSRGIETPRAPGKTVLASIVQQEQRAMPPPTVVSAPAHAPQRSASGSTVSSIVSQRRTPVFAESSVPVRTTSASSTDQSADEYHSATGHREDSRPPVSGKSSTRSRRGMSMDKFGLGKLLGSSNGSSDNVSRPPSRNREQAGAILHRNPSTRSRTKGPAAKPSLSIGVDADSIARRDADVKLPSTTQTPSTAGVSGASSASFPGQNSNSRINHAPAPAQGDARRPSDPLEAYGAEKTGDKRSRHTSMASSSAAKKVMDWFRRKSMARTSFAGPIGSSSEHSKSGNLETSYPGGQGVLVPSATAIRVEEASAPSSTSDVSHAIVPAERLPTAPMVTPNLPAPLASDNAASASSVARSTASRIPPPRATQPALSVGPATITTPASRQSSVKRRTARPSTAGGVISSIAYPLMARPAPPATPQESLLRAHNGVVDQAALTNRAAAEVMDDILKVLFDMGIEIKRESDFKLRCTRPSRRRAAIASVYSPGSRSGSMVSFGMGGSAATGATDARGLPIPNLPSTGLMSASAGLKGMLMRRGSTQNSISAQLSPDMTMSPSLSISSAPRSPREEPGLPEPLYGEHSVDSGDEVRFMVEVTRIKNLAGLLSLDIKRLKGNVWSYKFIYQTALQRCHTLTH